MLRRPVRRLRRAPLPAQDSGSLTDVPGPSGSATLTVNFGALSGADGVVLYYDTSSNLSTDPADWPYRKVQAGSGITSVSATGRASGSYSCCVAGYSGSTVGDLSQAISITAA